MGNLDVARKVMKEINAKKAKAKPGDPRQAIFFAGEHPEWLNFGVIGSGIIPLDTILHGGIRCGVTTVYMGKYGTGKTGGAMQNAKWVQDAYPVELDEKGEVKEDPGLTIWFLAESGFDSHMAGVIGVDLNRVMIIDGFTNAEEGIDVLFSLLWDSQNKCPRNIVKLVVIDSVAALVPKAEIDKIDEEGMESMTMGLHAKLMSKMNRVVRIKQGRCAILMINQIRADINSYGGGDKQTGGHTMYFDPKTIVAFSANNSGILYEGTGVNRKVVGHTVRIRTLKNNAGLGGHPGEEAEYEVYYGEGVDNFRPTIIAATVADIIREPSKSYYTIDLPKEVLRKYNLWREDGKKLDEPVKIHGMDALVDVFKQNDELFQLVSEALDSMAGGPADYTDLDILQEAVDSAEDAAIEEAA